MRCIIVIVAIAMVFTLGGAAYAVKYVGSDECFKCHPQEFNDFRVSGHPFKLMKAEFAKYRPLPLPEGYTWDDISYVIGGATKKARYIDKKGYIITSAKDGSDLKTQYNLATGTWSYYHKGQKKPYTCGKCHTTGYKPEGHQDGMEGIKGTWAFPGIQCEACHGPGGDHVKTGDRSKIVVDRSSALCGKCHIRGKKDSIPAKGGFIRHHEQYNELLASPHKSLNCVTCHNPHKKAEFSIKRPCETCHSSQAKAFKGSTMQQVGVRCIDCHMPKATKSAVKFGPYEGDVRTHLFKINTSADANMFYTKGSKTFAKGFVTVEFACLGCHKNNDKNWASRMATGVHTRGK